MSLKSPLKLGALSRLGSIKPLRLFEHLIPNIRSIATKRRNYSSMDLSFISGKVSRFLADNIIEPSHSPWRAQVVERKVKIIKNVCVLIVLTVVKPSTSSRVWMPVHFSQEGIKL